MGPRSCPESQGEGGAASAAAVTVSEEEDEGVVVAVVDSDAEVIADEEDVGPGGGVATVAVPSVRGIDKVSACDVEVIADEEDAGELFVSLALEAAGGIVGRSVVLRGAGVNSGAEKDERAEAMIGPENSRRTHEEGGVWGFFFWAPDVQALLQLREWKRALMSL